MNKMRNFWSHVARIMELYPDTTSYARKRFLERSDMEALCGDWEKVGGDMYCALQAYEQEKQREEAQAR